MSKYGEKSSSSSASGGIGFCGLLAVAFIVLKLIGVISWSWWWVLAPLWIPTVLVLTVLAIVGIVMLTRHFIKTAKRKKKDRM